MLFLDKSFNVYFTSYWMLFVPKTVRNTCLNFATDAFCSDAILESRLLHQDHYTEGWMSEKRKVTM